MLYYKTVGLACQRVLKTDMTNARAESKRIFVAGHRGMMGQAICRRLAQDPRNILIAAGRDELDLISQSNVRSFFERETIDEVYLCAAKVGGIHANSSYPAEFIYQNLMIEANVIHEAWATGLQRLMFLGSSCIYPRMAPQPIPEESLLDGHLEQTNEPYAIAKIAGIKLCESYNRQYGTDFRCAMPTNLYGTGDNYHPENSHVIPALIRRFWQAHTDGTDEVVVWGSGTPRREFLSADDAAAACVHIMSLGQDTYNAVTHPMMRHINVGSGEDISIADLAHLIARVIGYTGKITFDASKPDGTPRKLLDIGKLRALGWQPTIQLDVGIAAAVKDFASLMS
jgi:GDP-L-fucose synthase